MCERGHGLLTATGDRAYLLNLSDSLTAGQQDSTLCDSNTAVPTVVATAEGCSPDMSTRIEHDLLGYLEVPADAYYGVHTARAVDNFPISGIKLAIYPAFIAD